MKQINYIIALLFIVSSLHLFAEKENIASAVDVHKISASQNESILVKTLLYTSWLTPPEIMSKSYTELRDFFVSSMGTKCSDSSSFLESLNDDELAWSALMYKFLLDTRLSATDLTNMSLDDERNTLITLNNKNTDFSVSTLQSYSNARNLNIAYQWWFEQNESFMLKVDNLNSVRSSKAVFDLKDNQQSGMDVLKIVEANESAFKYLGVYHSQVSSNHFVLKLAGSNNLKTWTYIADIGDRSHQGDIKKWGDGYIVANEEDPVVGSNNIRVRFFSCYENLIINSASNDISLPQIFSTLAEGTPDIRTVIGDVPESSHIVIGFHFYDNGVHDQNAVGILKDFTNWRAWKDEVSNYNIQLMGYSGNIGGRSGFSYDGDYVLQEAQITSNDWSSWRLLLGDGAFYYTLSPETAKGSSSFANPGITSIGEDKFVVTSFLPTEGNQSGERGDLLYIVDLSEESNTSVQDGVNTADSAIKVYSKNGQIFVINALQSQVTIYDITGVIKEKRHLNSALESFNVAGVSIVSVSKNANNKFYKVMSN